jgi:CheY-like chemotaxis protein
MILLITSLAKAQDCAAALQEVIGEPVQLAASLHEAIAQLQAQEFSAVVLDQLLLDAEPDDVETIFKHMGTAVPVYSNFAISGIERVSRELRSAIHRRKRELLIARQEAEQALRSELKGTITALLLSCEMALSVPNLPLLAESKIRAVDALAREMRAKLGVTP